MLQVLPPKTDATPASGGLSPCAKSAARFYRALLVLLVLCAALVAVFGLEFAANLRRPQWEDERFFRYAETFTSVADALGRATAWKDLYRPLSTNLIYYAGAKWFAHDLVAYHSFSALIFLLNGILVFWVCRSFASFWFALLVSALFATRLASTEALLYTSQVQTLLPVFFSLLALKLCLVAEERGSLTPALLCALCVSCALFSKESSVTVPVMCVLAALLVGRAPPTHPRPPRWTQRLAMTALPFAGVVPWYLAGRGFWRIQDNPHWKYDLRPLELAGNYLAYALSYSNLLVRPVPLDPAYKAVPAVRFNSYPVLMSARNDQTLQALFLVACVLCGAVVLKAAHAALARRERPPEWVRVAAFGFAAFLLALAPVVIFKGRLLMYYGYFGHFGLSLVVALGLRAAFLRLLRLAALVAAPPSLGPPAG